jgi:hypothetical protein
MSKIVRLTESDLVRLVKKVIEEQSPEVWAKQEKIKANLAAQEKASQKYIDEIQLMFDYGPQFYDNPREGEEDKFGYDDTSFTRLVKQPDGSVYMYTLIGSGWQGRYKGSGYPIIKFTCNQPYFLTAHNLDEKIYNKKLTQYMQSKFCKR